MKFNILCAILVLLLIVLINSYMGTRLKEQFISREMAEGLVDRGVEKFVDLGLDALQIKAEKFKNKKKKNKTKQAIKNMRENINNGKKKRGRKK